MILRVVWWVRFGWRREYRKCPHPWWRVRCIHGDEIMAFGYWRSQCLECLKIFRDLPEWCWYSHKPHSSSSNT